MSNKLHAIDLFSGCGGLTQGLKDAGYNVFAAVEMDPIASDIYSLNHPGTKVYNVDIRTIATNSIKKEFPSETTPLHLLAACPPCQGFSTLRTNNKRRAVFDKRNSLISEFVRFVTELRPLTIMMENVPGLENYYLFRNAVTTLKRLGYYVVHSVVDVADYQVPQHRNRLILLGALNGQPSIAARQPRRTTVRSAIGKLPLPEHSTDELHKITISHTAHIQELIKHIPLNGGSRRALPMKFQLNCHKGKDAGFNDVYGRLRWDDVSVTITGGCLNPSKGRFLHPEQNRVISPREASLLQSFPPNYKFLSERIKVPKSNLALMIGNALPPKFCEIQSKQLISLTNMNESGVPL